MALIRIDYDEPDQSTYRKVEVVSPGSVVEKEFATGDPQNDFLDAMLYASKHCAPPILLSSTCDHFVTDGDKYSWIETKLGSLIYEQHGTRKNQKPLKVTAISIRIETEAGSHVIDIDGTKAPVRFKMETGGDHPPGLGAHTDIIPFYDGFEISISGEIRSVKTR